MIPSLITQGHNLEHGIVYYISEDGIHLSIKIDELFGGKRIVVFGGPAPFSRLDNAQAEQYEQASAQILKLGVDQVISIYCQDAFVVNQFGRFIAAAAGSNNIKYYGDGDGFFIRNYSLDRDFTFQGLSVRSERWCAVVNGGRVEFVAHDEYSEIKHTHVDKVMEWLKS